MKLYLLRHGLQEEVCNREINPERLNPDLSCLGRKQADLLGRCLSTHGISAIYASDLKRAVQTAKIANHYICLTVKYEPGLREIDMGEVLIKGWDQIAVENPTFYREFQQHDSDIAYPGGESGLDVQQRSLPVIQNMVANYPADSNLAIVCHGGVIMVLLTAFSGMTQEQRFRFQIDHCSISIVEYDFIQQSFQILSVNDTTHLEEKKEERK